MCGVEEPPSRKGTSRAAMLPGGGLVPSAHHDSPDLVHSRRLLAWNTLVLIKVRHTLGAEVRLVQEHISREIVGILRGDAQNGV